jgi:hypothetical protein
MGSGFFSAFGAFNFLQQTPIKKPAESAGLFGASRRITSA